jgi:hypothetical protein
MVVFLIDADNLSSPAWIDEACHRLEAVEGGVAVRRAYGSAENLKGLAEVLRAWAIRPFVNLSLTKNTTDVALAVDAMELACQTPAPTVLALGSGDADFVPLVVRLRERGIRLICVTERSKMAQEAAHAYDEVMLVGAERPKPARSRAAPAQAAEPAMPSTVARRPRAAKTPVGKTVAAHEPGVKTVPKKTALHRAGAASAGATVAQILEALPALRSGKFTALGEVTKSLHDAKLIGRNAGSTKLFSKHLDHFELAPAKQPNQVRYLLRP